MGGRWIWMSKQMLSDGLWSSRAIPGGLYLFDLEWSQFFKKRSVDREYTFYCVSVDFAHNWTILLFGKGNTTFHLGPFSSLPSTITKTPLILETLFTPSENQLLSVSCR